jgi:hypothetical protein
MKTTFRLVVLFSLLFGNSVYAQESKENSQTLSLDGEWEIIFDSENRGKEKGWYLDENFDQQSNKREIKVPSCWEEIEKDYEGVAFYRRKFNVPESWEGRIVQLHFDAVNFKSEVWINDQEVGFHEGGYTPFDFRIDKLLKAGEENTVTLRVVSAIIMSGKETIDGTIGKQQAPQWRGGIAGGIWQSVKLKSTGNAGISDVFIQPKIADNSVKIDLDLENTTFDELVAEVDVVLSSPEGSVVAKEKNEVSLFPGSNKSEWNLTIPNAQYWSGENPYLYKAEINVNIDGNKSDSFESRFGMREFTVKNDQYFLNGKPIYLRGCFFEGLYPVKGAYPDSEEMARKEIMLAKEAGFNMIRPWRKPPPQMWLDLCDELGVLTVGSNVVECMFHPLSSTSLTHWVENEIRETIMRDRNRTCVIMWELFNEIQRPVLAQMLQPMSNMARELDPTRMILDESGGFGEGARLYLPYERIGQKFNDVHDYVGSQVTEDFFDGYRLIGTTPEERENMGYEKIKIPGKNVVPGRMTFVSEMGYGSLPNLVDNIKRFEEEGNEKMPAARYTKRIADQTTEAMKLTGFDEIYPDLEKFCLDQQIEHGRVNKRLIEAVRSNPNAAGYCIHALTGGDWVIGAGLLDLWRNPKTAAYEKTKEGNQDRIVSIRVLPRNIYAEKGGDLQITGVNVLEDIDTKINIEIVSENGETILKEKLKAKLGNGINELYNSSLKTEQLKGEYTVKVSVEDRKGNLIASNERSFDVFRKEQHEVPKAKIAIIDPLKSMIPFLKEKGIGFEIFGDNTDINTPVFVASVAPKMEKYNEDIRKVTAFADKGGKVVHLQMGNRVKLFMEPRVEGSPFNAEPTLSKGLWSGYPHIVRKHKIFEGLPTECIMNNVYENISPHFSMNKQPTPYIMGTVFYFYYTGPQLDNDYYLGPDNVSWASDIQIIKHGKGKVLLSTLKLVQNLGKDPVADMVFYNMIEFIGQ